MTKIMSDLSEWRKLCLPELLIITRRCALDEAADLIIQRAHTSGKNRASYLADAEAIRSLKYDWEEQ